MSIRFNSEKSCKRSVNHHFRKGVSAFAGSPYMMSRDQLWYVMTSSAIHGDTLILSGTDASIRWVIIWSLNINLVSGIGLISELFDPPTYTNRKFSIRKVTTQNPHQNVDYRMITDPFRTVSLSKDSHLTVWLNRFMRSTPSNHSQKLCFKKKLHIRKLLNDPPDKGRLPTANLSGEAIKIITQTFKVVKIVL